MKYCSFDIETTGLDPRTDKIFSYCIGHMDTWEVEVCRLDGKDRQRNLDHLYDFFEDTQTVKIAHNYKFELGFLTHGGYHIPVMTQWEDTMLMSQLLRNNAQSHRLEILGWEFFGWNMDLDKRIKILGKQLGNFQKIPELLMHEYQVADGVRPLLLFQLWQNDFINNSKLMEDYRNEIRLVQTTIRLEDAGMMIHRQNAERLLNVLNKELNSMLDQTKQIFGEYVNINSDSQLRRILYNQYRLPIIAYTDTGLSSVDKTVLMELREKYSEHTAIFEMIMKYRSYTNGTAMIRSYLEHADENDIIHPTINTNIATTGRESSKDPNLQNVAKEKVRNNLFPVPSRKCFRAPQGDVLLFADYAGQEIRLIADLSQDDEMLRLLQEKIDIHTEAAYEWYGEKFYNLDKDDPEKYMMRTAGKNTTFGRCYGAGAAKLAGTLGVNLSEAQAGLERFSRRFPRAARFSSMMTDTVIVNGYVETPFGRKLYIPKRLAYRGGNYIIQGTAAGMIKRAQNNIDEYLLHSWDGMVRLLIPIHDEVILRMSRKVLSHLSQIIKELDICMTEIKELSVPMEVEWKMSTTTWDKAKELKLYQRGDHE